MSVVDWVGAWTIFARRVRAIHRLAVSPSSLLTSSSSSVVVTGIVVVSQYLQLVADFLKTVPVIRGKTFVQCGARSVGAWWPNRVCVCGAVASLFRAKHFRDFTSTSLERLKQLASWISQTRDSETLNGVNQLCRCSATIVNNSNTISRCVIFVKIYI